ncbi:iron-sulfur cluster carrier protein ApbC [Solimonas marina]|nr:iron-sulfur cluster carrier protein ApbC [Solimonas marina]
MSVTRDQLLSVLDSYVHPLIGRGLVAAGAVARAEVQDDTAQVVIELGFPVQGISADLAQELGAKLNAELGLIAELAIGKRIDTHGARANLQTLPGIRNIIAVASGKGGVGKSTVAANLALALHAEGARVGLLDADIYGPSQPRMFGVSSARPTSPDGKRMNPVPAHGIQTMSIGYLVDEDQPMIWRGPMVTQALGQLLNETIWDDVEYLVIDLPPGTGDIQLTLSQRIPVSGAVIVTTPQEIALLDAKKGLQMFRRVEVPVLGIVENMAWYDCGDHRDYIFGQGGGERMAAQYGVELLGQLPLSTPIREQADNGQPIVVAAPDGEAAQTYRQIARRAAAQLAYGTPAADFPTIEISDD